MLRHFKVERQRDELTRQMSTVTYRWVDWPDGSTWDQAVVMPAETLAIRAGEYGIDPGNTDLLLDVVMHELFIAYPDGAHPLWVAGSIREAREQHLDLVADVRKAHEEFGSDYDRSKYPGRFARSKGYPDRARHQEMRARHVAQSTITPAIVDAARIVARDTWQRIQSAAEVSQVGPKMTSVELQAQQIMNRRS